ncbi:MAG: hypothetical protein F6K22_26810 [Okeania sp. SIO2F4]|uniref:cache domain-containing protein n=1 Tax=Okeania sp. SIO2F4 TaxID=2607790 RepID=UPI00142B1C76|nr:cache domain-containing protein [Okeania sp. SIO2F4]NES06101.1 hypothetical protein [Okeania sp. SIO2F4]
MATIPPINEVYEFLENYLNDEENSTVFGTALAYNPDLESSSPFVFRGETGLERVDIADNFDYTQAIWYQVPVEMEEALWSDPYFDVRGAGEDIALTTYSIPLYENGEFVAFVFWSEL